LLHNHSLNSRLLIPEYKLYNDSLNFIKKPEIDEEYEFYKNQEYYEGEYYLLNDSADLVYLEFLYDFYLEYLQELETNDNQVQNQDSHVIFLSDSNFNEFDPMSRVIAAFSKVFEEPIMISSSSNINNEIFLLNDPMNPKDKNSANSFFQKKPFFI
jgi:hypothetical protein